MIATDLSARDLWDLIADSIASYLKSYEVEDYCVGLGLAPAQEGEDPFRSKRVYVRARLTKLPLEHLRELAGRVAAELGDTALAERLAGSGPRGVDGELKNIIFASAGPKPRIVMIDALNNIIDIVENRNSCLVYDRAFLRPGLTWAELTEWWAGKHCSADPARDLYQRLSRSLASPPERLLFRTYCERYGRADGASIPALLPQVYLHYDPYTRAERINQVGEIRRERMDFLLLMPNRVRVVIEVDGQHHYADSGGGASPAKYSEMVAEDRKIRLRGYEVYRFGGYELGRPDAPAELAEFFDQLLSIHASER
jgi:hypothetical protein